MRVDERDGGKCFPAGIQALRQTRAIPLVLVNMHIVSPNSITQLSSVTFGGTCSVQFWKEDKCHGETLCVFRYSGGFTLAVAGGRTDHVV